MFLVIESELTVSGDFAERLAEAMQDAGINARSLAAGVGVKESAVSQWLSRKIEQIKAVHLFAAADLLGVEPRWLCLGEGPKRHRLSPELAALTDDQIAALRSLLTR